MKRDNPLPKPAKPDHRRPSAGPRTAASPKQLKPAAPNSATERATASERNGVASDSLHPRLRDQLRLKALLAPPLAMAPPDEPHRGKDDHHR